MRVGPDHADRADRGFARLERRRDDRGLPLPGRGVFGADRDVQRRGVGTDVLRARRASRSRVPASRTGGGGSRVASAGLHRPGWRRRPPPRGWSRHPAWPPAAARRRAAAGRVGRAGSRPPAAGGGPGRPCRSDHAARPASPSASARLAASMLSGRSITRLSTRPCWPTARIITVGPRSISSRRITGSSIADGGTARPAYCVRRESSCTLPFSTSSRSTIASVK